MLNSAIVSPIGCKMRDCQPSGMRSSRRNGRKSLTLPPRMVTSVDELKTALSSRSVFRGSRSTHLELLKNLQMAGRLYWGLSRLDSARRFPESRERSATVKSPPGPVPLARSSSMRRLHGLPWSRWKTESSPAYDAAVSTQYPPSPSSLNTNELGKHHARYSCGRLDRSSRGCRSNNHGKACPQHIWAQKSKSSAQN